MKKSIIFCFVILPTLALAQKIDSIPVIGSIVRNMKAIDTDYIEPSQYHLSVRLLNNNQQEEVRMKSEDGTNIVVRSPFTPSIGIGLSYDGLGYSYSLKLRKNELADGTKKTDIGFSSNTQMISVSGHFRRTGGDYRLKKMVLPGIGDITHPNNEIAGQYTSDRPTYNNINIGEDCSIKMFDLNVNYIWNHKKYSAPAGTSFSNRQKRSAGSLITGLGYAHYNIENDFGDWQAESAILSAYSRGGSAGVGNMMHQLATDSKAQQDFGRKFCTTLKFSDYQANIGYSYNWVPIKNLMLNASFTLSPTIKVCSGNNDKCSFIKLFNYLASDDEVEQALGYVILQLYMSNIYPDLVTTEIMPNDAVDTFKKEINGQDLSYSYNKTILDFNYNLHLAAVWNIDRWYAGAQFNLQHYRYHSRLYTNFDNSFADLNFTVGYRFWEKKRK